MKKNEEENSTGNPTRNRKAGEAIHTQFQSKDRYLYSDSTSQVSCDFSKQNMTDWTSTTDTGVDEYMGYKINRKVYIHNQLRWVHANSEQDYADKIGFLYLMGQTSIAVPSVQEKHNFTEYAWNWYNIYSKPNIEEVTAITYKRQIQNCLVPAFGEMFIEDITTDLVQKLFNDMAGKKDTKNKVKIVLNQILNSAVEDGYLAKNPLKSNRIKVTGEASEATKPYSVEQMQRLVQGIPRMKKENDRLFTALIACHPLRLEEALGLMWDDIDFENSCMRIQRAVTHPDRNRPVVKPPKTKASMRTIGMSKVLIGLLEQMTIRSGFILGGENPLTYTQVRKICERIEEDLAFGERITPRRFRTTVLTDIYNETKDVTVTKQAAGHEMNSPTTFKNYVKGRQSSNTSAYVIDSLYLTELQNSCTAAEAANPCPA